MWNGMTDANGKRLIIQFYQAGTKTSSSLVPPLKSSTIQTIRWQPTKFGRIFVFSDLEHISEKTSFWPFLVEKTLKRRSDDVRKSLKGWLIESSANVISLFSLNVQILKIIG